MSFSIPYGRQSINAEDIQAVVEVLTSDYLTQGPKIKEFEEAFATYVDAKYAVVVANGTAALHLANLCLNLKKGQKVLTTPITFAATANTVLHCGAEVDFVDIDPDTYLMDLDKLEEKLAAANPNTYVGLIPVDFTGLPVNTEKLRTIADKYNLWIIEDACHAPGGYFINSDGEKIRCGSNKYTNLTCFSFHPVKHIAAGEGGMITTNNKEYYKKLLRLRTHGISKKMDNPEGGWSYEMDELGFNYRLPDINAALGLSQLESAKENLNKRYQIAQKYDASFKNINGIKIQHQSKNSKNAYHLYVIEVGKRKKLYDYLRAKGICAQVHYIPVPQLAYYKKLGFNVQDYPIAKNYYNNCLSIPMYPSLKKQDQDHVIECIIEFVTENV